MVVKMFEYFYEEVRFEIFCKGVSVLWGKIVSIDLVFEGNFLSVDLVFERISIDVLFERNFLSIDVLFEKVFEGQWIKLLQLS